MEVFILTILRKDLVDLVEVFDTYQSAFEYGMRFSQIINIADQYFINRQSPQMRGVVLVDSPEYFIWILTRAISALVPDPKVLNMKSYNDLADLVSGKSIPILAPTSAKIIPTIKDDPWEASLPIGFHYLNNRGMTVGEAQLDPDGVKYIMDLTDNQRWALTLARVNKRPEFQITIKVNGIDKTFNQAEALDALKNDRYINGSLIVEKEINLISSYMDELNDSKSSSQEYYDESSSDDFG